MTAFDGVLNSLGWSLLETVWQMALTWLLYSVITTGEKNFSAAGKHNLALMFITISTGWFLYSFIHYLQTPGSIKGTGFIGLSPVIQQPLSWFGAVYLIILLVRAIRYLRFYHQRHRLAVSQSVSVDLIQFTERHARIMGIRRRVQVCISAITETAFTVGFIKPFIYLPVSLLTLLTPQQVEAIIVHELYHIRRNDYLTHILVLFYKNVFFFNPFAALFCKAVAREREHACDDGVLEKEYHPDVYVNALLILEKFRQGHAGLFLSATGNDRWMLMQRIRRLLGQPTVRTRSVGFLFFISCLLAMGSLSIRQQTLEKLTDNLPTGRHKTVQAFSKLNEPAAGYKIRSLPATALKSVTVRKLPVSKPVIEAVPESPVVPEEIIFSGEQSKMEFSNQASVTPVQDAAFSLPGMPYVPSMSLSYDILPENVSADSLREVATAFKLSQLEILNRSLSVTHLEELRMIVDKTKKQLKEFERQQQPAMQAGKKQMKILLNQAGQELIQKNAMIDSMEIRLKVNRKEIIHI